MTRLEKGLRDALERESVAHMKYLAFASKAEKEGYKLTAKLFRAAAEAEAVHARNHLRALGVSGHTRENLGAALGECRESVEVYSPIMEDAKAESDRWATKSSCYALEAGRVFAALFERALDTLGKEEEAEYHICRVCGFTAVGGPPEKCPVCGSRKETFNRIE